ncbi:hypothetical protein [Nitrosomonas oligotropha]|uniref:RHS repeat-associated core domain-containing protein n=1 Tax=Nitrosomonas oligotropha TaxID=42354 RepID=A0A1H8JEW9_9PROT|nr:hypothetical protein [Nitrosomonas oligotropha]SDW04336.1 RHS repeat-associated core domain-containing protein [Nitrosomonas oligotropha]SEN79393.1 RHS repeat-associated core domain-containing protein [Nitrosomonas oligotropha]
MFFYVPGGQLIGEYRDNASTSAPIDDCLVRQEIGLHYNYFHYHEPVTGSYISPDPIDLAGGMNVWRIECELLVKHAGGRNPVLDSPTNGNWGANGAAVLVVGIKEPPPPRKYHVTRSLSTN